MQECYLHLLPHLHQRRAYQRLPAQVLGTLMYAVRFSCHVPFTVVCNEPSSCQTPLKDVAAGQVKEHSVLLGLNLPGYYTSVPSHVLALVIQLAER